MVEVVDVSKIIEGNTILTSIDFAFERGSIYCLRGHNGCGKTMLLRVIAGLIFPSRGKVVFEGQVVGKDVEFPDSLGLLIERPAFLEGYSGSKNLELLCSIKKTASSDDISLALERVGLDAADQRPFRKYSLGMKQKLGIAGAIVEHPDLILLDEPLNGLDEEAVRKTLQVIQEERLRGACLLVASHDVEKLAEIADATILMESGSIVDVERANPFCSRQDRFVEL